MQPVIVSIEAQLNEVTELVSLPEIYIKFNSLMDNPHSDINDFAKLIRMDSNLTTKLLNIVNSAYYGFSGEIDNIATAISMLGIQQLHIMVLSISAVNAVSSLTFPKDIVDLKTFWRSSLLSGMLARKLAYRLKVPSMERLFILGLLHEIGHLFLYSQFPDECRQAIQLSNKKHLRVDQAEQQLFGCHYGKIGAQLMQHWLLPESFQELINTQPTPEQATCHKIEISILHIAHAYAHKHFIETDKELEQLISPCAWQITQLTPDDIQQTLEDALTASAEMEMSILM